MSKKKILVIDDDADIRFMLTYFLEGQGYKVQSAEDGSKALSLLEHSKTDAPEYILLDWIMPGMDGLTFLKNLEKKKAHFEQTCFIILTGIDICDNLPTLGQSMNVVTKPFGIDQVIKMLAQRKDMVQAS